MLSLLLIMLVLCVLQDGKTLDFMYYFDFVRAYPKDYANMTATHAYSSSSSSTNTGRPPAVKVVGKGAPQQQQKEEQEDYEE